MIQAADAQASEAVSATSEHTRVAKHHAGAAARLVVSLQQQLQQDDKRLAAAKDSLEVYISPSDLTPPCRRYRPLKP